MKLIYVLYKTIRIETGEYYIGVHGIDTDRYPDFNDGYLGSGIRIAASVKKHNQKSFRRSFLAINESREIVLELEIQTVTAEMIADPLCLNLSVGGRAGVKGSKRSAEFCQSISDAMKGIPKSVECRQKLRELALERFNSGRFVSPNLTRSDGSSIVSDRVKAGLFVSPGLRRSDGSSLASDRVIKGTHNFQKRADGSTMASAQLKAGTHTSQIMIECVHCGLVCSKNNHTRWHGDRCKHFKPNSD